MPSKPDFVLPNVDNHAKLGATLAKGPDDSADGETGTGVKSGLPPPQYVCFGGKCSMVAPPQVGVYFTMEDCMSQCTAEPRYGCSREHICVKMDNGPYTSQRTCQAYCTPPPPQRWNCGTNNQCVSSPFGQYLNQQQCN